VSEKPNIKFDFKFQNKILALLVKDSEFSVKYGNIINPRYFTDIYHQMLCEKAVTYAEKYGEQVTLEVLFEEVDKEKSTEKRELLASSLEEICDTELNDRAYFEERVVEFCKNQSMLLALKQSVQSLKEGDREAILPSLEKALMVGQQLDDASMGTRFWNSFDKEEEETWIPRVPTLLGPEGSGGMDDVLNGGLKNGQLGMVMLPTGRGKSVFLLNIAANAIIQNYNVLYFSLEMDERDIKNRFSSWFTGLSTKILEKLPNKDIQAKIFANYSGTKLGDLLIKTFPMKSTRVRGLETHVKAFSKKDGWVPDLIIVDYLDVVRSSSKKETHEQLGEISEELKGLAQRFDRPVWTASQVNRSGAQKEIVKNEDGAGSYAKLFAADFVFAGAPKSDEKTGERSVKLFCSKARGAEDQMILDYEIDFKAMRFLFRERSNQNKESKKAFDRFMDFKK
jgi:replicative DNA helicase